MDSCIDGKGATDSGQALSGDYESPVVKRGVLEEQVHYETAVDGCVYPVACADDIVERHVVRYDDERSGLVFRHISACFCDFVDCLASGTFRFSSLEQPVDDLLASRALHPAVADSDEELSDFRLEYYDQRKHTDIKNCLHQCIHQSHV